MRRLTRISVLGFRLATFVLVVYWSALFIGTHLPRLPQVDVEHADKYMHFFAFAGLAFFLAWVVPAPRGLWWAKALVLLGIIAAYAIIDEISQGWVGRSTDVYDFIADMCGAAGGLCVYAAIRSGVNRYIDRPQPHRLS
ncbi:MAG: VanZ family protein [Planctomycetota bacterium]